MLSGKEVRKKFIEYFQSKGHTHVASSSLVPTMTHIIITNAGMNQFKDIFLGWKKTLCRAVTSKNAYGRGKHNDLDTVGRTARHHTFLKCWGIFLW